ncbi:MAG TPA: LON peptidase substrate-binding domain-containing protein, partial [Prosthecobacter sp.]|nr:LON peptidase substrate-binding domain-containing protein [Prosthecobacter sp.]
MSSETTSEEAAPLVLPILPLRNTSLFPGVLIPLNIGRPATLRLLEESLPQSKTLGLVLQKDSESENPKFEDLYEHGVSGKVIRMLRQGPDGAIVLVQGDQRIRMRRPTQEEPFLKAEVEILPSKPLDNEDDYQKAALQNLRESAEKLLNLRPDVPDEVKAALAQIEDPSFLTDFLASNLSIELTEKQKLLEETDVARRVASVQKLLDNQLHIAELQGKLRENVQSEFSEAQKRAYL